MGRCSLEIRRKRTLTDLERVANTYGKGHWSIILHGLRYEFLHSAPIPTRAVTGIVIMMQHLQYSTLLQRVDLFAEGGYDKLESALETRSKSL